MRLALRDTLELLIAARMNFNVVNHRALAAIRRATNADFVTRLDCVDAYHAPHG